MTMLITTVLFHFCCAAPLWKRSTWSTLMGGHTGISDRAGLFGANSPGRSPTADGSPLTVGIVFTFDDHLANRPSAPVAAGPDLNPPPRPSSWKASAGARFQGSRGTGVYLAGNPEGVLTPCSTI